MIKPIYRKLNSQRNSWERYFVTTSSGNTDDVNFQEPTYYKDIKLIPVDTRLYVKEYLKIAVPARSKLTFKYVVDCIPKTLLEDVVAVEWVYGFFNSYEASFFAEDYMKGNVALFIALLTEKETGKDLPGLRIPKAHKPIGVSDEEWTILLSALS